MRQNDFFFVVATVVLILSAGIGGWTVTTAALLAETAMGDVGSILYAFIATYVTIALLGHVLLIAAIIKCWRMPPPRSAASPQPSAPLLESAAAISASPRPP
jgi:hypothetical protein